ncbi:MAG: ATP-binding protein [Clostridia bacterium]|nr:ATP-binding protein [Clostridia bacterium]MDE7328949.1 ATP-binding protein [Clostridia bacterium]
MIKYFTQKLELIYSTKRALAKEESDRNNKELLSRHPQLAQMLKDKKSLELELARKKVKGQDISEDEKALIGLDNKIKEYVKTNSLSFSPKYSCKICKDGGYVDKKPCECLLREYRLLLEQNKSVSPMPKFTFADNTFATSNSPYAAGMNKLYGIMQKKVCENFYDCKWKNFMLAGASGVGKTCLALAIANDLLDKNVSVLYLSSFELINIFLDKHTRKQTALSKLFDYVLECEMLIIDNFGGEPIYKNVTLEYLFSTIEKRIATGKKTMICTALDGGAIINRYGAAFLSKFSDKKYSLSVGYITDK